MPGIENLSVHQGIVTIPAVTTNIKIHTTELSSRPHSKYFREREVITEWKRLGMFESGLDRSK